MIKTVLKIAYFAAYAAAAGLLVWRYFFSGGQWTMTAALIALGVGAVVHTAYNIKYKPRPD